MNRPVLLCLAAIACAHLVFGMADSLTSAKEFAIGGIGVVGTLSPAELALREMRDGPDALTQLRNLLRDQSLATRMYALYGLKQLEAPDYEELAKPYRSSKEPVRRIQGCMISDAPSSEVVKWIDQNAKQIRAWEKNEPPQMKPQK